MMFTRDIKIARQLCSRCVSSDRASTRCPLSEDTTEPHIMSKTQKISNPTPSGIQAYYTSELLAAAIAEHIKGLLPKVG